MTKTLFNFLFLITISFLFTNCKTNRIINGFKHGKWILTDTIDSVIYKQVAFYKKGEEVRTWKTFKNHKKYKTEKYKKESCQVTFYHPNGKIAIKGQTKQEVSEKEIHWYYYGDWFFFDENGTLIQTKIYENGTLLNDFD